MSKPADPAANSPPTGASVARVVLASFVGTMIEWYDFFLYGTAAALVFDRLFFPVSDPFLSRMASYGSFAIGFFLRPLGGVIFGHFGDRHGRKSMLVLTLVLMGLATFLIGVLPTYESIGIAAPIALVALRMIQGLGVGGEWGGAVLMAVEHGHAGRRGLYGSCVQMGVPAGLLLAAGVFAVVERLPEEQFLAWGWRVPFLLGIVLLGVGLFIRYQVFESPLFADARKQENISRLPIVEVLTTHGRSVVLAMAARFAENACFYIFSVFVLSYATDWLQMDRQVLLQGVWWASAAQLVAIPAFGLLSDTFGRRPLYFAGAVAVAALAFPFFRMLETRDPVWCQLAIVLGLLAHAAMYGPQAAFFAELFGTRVRYSGASLGYQLASPLAGGLAPLVATALLKFSGGEPWPVACYLIATVALTLTAIALSGETHRAEL